MCVTALKDKKVLFIISQCHFTCKACKPTMLNRVTVTLYEFKNGSRDQ